MQNETVREEAVRIVEYAMRKGGETLFVADENYPTEWEVIGDFLTGSWCIRCHFTKEEALYCWRLMSKDIESKECSKDDAIARVVQLLKAGGILV